VKLKGLRARGVDGVYRLCTGILDAWDIATLPALTLVHFKENDFTVVSGVLTLTNDIASRLM
jgi:hypothetical protein